MRNYALVKSPSSHIEMLRHCVKTSVNEIGVVYGISIINGSKSQRT